MDTDRTASTAIARNRPSTSSIALVAGLIIALTGTPARALMVGVTNNVVPNTSTNPASTVGWTQGDPGWANAAQFGYFNQTTGQVDYSLNGVYIGDGWVLSAAHTGVPTKVRFESGATFDPIPNQNWQVANPTWNDSRLVEALSDLRLIRINGDPGLPSLPIATQALSTNDQIVIMGSGFVRAGSLSYFTVNTSTMPWQWTPTVNNQPCSGSSCYSGYYPNGNGKRWGTNRIANSDSVLGENDGNLQTIISGGTIGYITTYDQNASTITDPFESLAVNLDSGSAVFYKRNGQWQLAGIINAKYNYSGQSNLDPSNTLAIFGNANAFADLAAYNTPGNSKIAQILNAHVDYSAVGDINLDGASGTAADLSAFVAGWRYNNSTGLGTITSWKNGDVTHDGKTDVNDFLRLRNSLNAGAGAQLTAMLSDYASGGVPEPSTAMLALGPVVLFALRRRRRPRLAA